MNSQVNKYTIKAMEKQMIAPNRHSDETIHIANWLLGAVDVSLSDLIAEAGQEAEQRRDSDWTEDEFDQEFREEFAETLKDAITLAIWDAIPDSHGSVIEYEGYCRGEEFYVDANPATLILPMIASDVRRVCFDDVAALILERVAA